MGLTGLVGAGRTETMQAVTGITKADSGSIFLDGRQLTIRRPKDAMKAGIDISITSTLAFSGMIIGLLQKYDVIHNTFLLFLIGTLIGAACGLLNGLIISKGKVATIICTMGAMYIWRGMAYVIPNNAWASGADVSGFSDFGKEGAIGPYIILVIAYIVCVKAPDTWQRSSCSLVWHSSWCLVISIFRLGLLCA